ncbi:MAG: carboxypeptidase regulatory-like domain-containing protein, partial [Planctomycetes bacterium]|nr:carboxypeptidase regulatory-like domain-containing protein [Planctomycetota bacterium]
MEKRIAIACLAAFTAVFSGIARAESRDEAWKQVEEAMKKGLPKTAIERLDPIIEGALKDEAYPEAIKAIGRKIALEGMIERNGRKEVLIRLQAEIAKAPAAMRPAMEAILGHRYWRYFLANRWRFMQRTQMAAPAGEDIATWDLARILAEIDSHFAAALAAKDMLWKTPIGSYDALLVEGTMPDRYRPTLYDFLAHEALAFYAAGEQAGARAQDAFDLSADSPIFAPPLTFIEWDVAPADEASPTVKAIRLYQDLLRHHIEDADRTACLDVDLERLVFGNEKAFGEEKVARYKAALRRFIEGCEDHEISALARHHLACALRDEGALVDAHGIASQGRNGFPGSPGGKLCANLILEIEAKSASISTERVWNRPFPTISVRYRNLTEVHFRAYAYDWIQLLDELGSRPEWIVGDERKALLAREPTLAWSIDLPPTSDYKERIEEIPAPEDIAPGFYCLVASHDRSFGEEENQVSFTDIWVSDLALVVRSRSGEGVLEGFVLDANGGEPVPQAEVRAWQRSGNRWGGGPGTRTDANGFFRFLGIQGAQVVLHVQKDGRALTSANTYWINDRREDTRPQARTVFFTDRSLYRPGQTIGYKGLCIEIDQERDDYRALAKQDVTVIFADPNDNEIARATHRTNAYGSFSGSFTAPRDRLMGRMSIRVDGGPPGAVAIDVEEYKRPKFRVEIDPPEEAAKLGAEVIVTGRAMAYTGAAIDRARIRYRV